ncbi:MAG: RnfH family protein [Rhodocyclaceae bacterium]|nr:RnfH family protein [Rhodocyclaceae bacterium]
MTDMIEIEVVYARRERQDVIPLRLPVGSTVEDALAASGLLERYPEIDLARGKFGIYGKICRLDAVLRDHDRVEIYRPLIADPKEVRKQRAAEGKALKKGAGALAAPAE